MRQWFEWFDGLDMSLGLVDWQLGVLWLAIAIAAAAVSYVVGRSGARAPLPKERIAGAEIRPGDIVVVTCGESLGAGERQDVYLLLTGVFGPEVRLLILDGGLELSAVLRAEGTTFSGDWLERARVVRQQGERS